MLISYEAPKIILHQAVVFETFVCPSGNIDDDEGRGQRNTGHGHGHDYGH